MVRTEASEPNHFGCEQCVFTRGEENPPPARWTCRRQKSGSRSDCRIVSCRKHDGVYLITFDSHLRGTKLILCNNGTAVQFGKVKEKIIRELLKIDLYHTFKKIQI